MERIASIMGRCKSYVSRSRQWAAGQFERHPQLLTAAIAFILGFFAIVLRFPTKEGSTTLAGALFGAGAAFIGAWITEANRSATETLAKKRRIEAARSYFTPELARMVARQIDVAGRLVANFVTASVGRRMPREETWESFRPGHPLLYPAASQLADLPDTEASLLVDFYDSVQGVAEMIDAWVEAAMPQDVNGFNVLMQAAHHSLVLGGRAVHQFCPARQLSPLLPASGTLLQNIERTDAMVKSALDAHLSRHQAQAAAVTRP